MIERRLLRAVLALTFGLLAVSTPLATTGLSAQSITRGAFEGSVREVGGGALGFVAVTMIDLRSGSTLFLETDRQGEFSVPLLGAGDYEVRVEIPGYIPVLIRDVGIRAGQGVRAAVELRPSPPPVESVDTLYLGAGGHARTDAAGARWVRGSSISRFASPRMNLGDLASLNPAFDVALGALGLPGSSTGIVLDGLPYLPASHPYQQGAANLPLFPLIGLANLNVHYNTDVEWAGSEGGYISGASRRGSSDSGMELYGAGTSGALWQSDGFDGIDTPDMVSGWGGGAAHISLDDSGSALFVGLEGVYEKTPRLSPLSAELATDLASAFPGVEGIDTSDLAGPWISELRSVTGLSRFDWRGEETEITGRATFATLSQSGAQFFGSPLSYGRTAPQVGLDASILASALTRLRPDLWIEGRLSAQRSTRDWNGPEGGNDDPTVSPTLFVGEGTTFGADPGLAGHVGRSTFTATGIGHLRWNLHWLKVGVRGILSAYEYEHVPDPYGTYFVADPAALASGDGFFRRVLEGSTESSFTVPEIGVFAQHVWQAQPNLRLTTGLRFDYETLPQDDVELVQAWAGATFLANTDFEAALPKIGPRFAVEWSPGGDRSTVLEGAVAADYGRIDPAALHEVIGFANNVHVRRQIGGLDAWPELPTGQGEAESSGELLALFDPDLEAPRTARGTLGISQAIGGGFALTVSGTYRRTESLMRRTDLNLPVVPSGLTAEGRPIYGVLQKSGAVVAPVPQSEFRFQGNDHVWALNSDGHSEYLGATLSVEYDAGETVDLFASYTYSSTEDNLVGARDGHPEAELTPSLSGPDGDDWDEGTSDFDIPHRLSAGFGLSFPLLQGLEASALYRYRSGYAFTPGYRRGVDVNGDGSGLNDPALVPAAFDAGGSFDTTCLNSDRGSVATRNACRSDGVHSMDLHLVWGLFRIGSSTAAVTIDLFNLTDAELGLPDPALLLVTRNEALSTDTQSGVVDIPLSVNPSFGEVTRSVRPGRMIRVGFRVEVP